MPRLCEPVTCGECGKVIKRKGDLTRHMLLHAPNKEELMRHCPVEGCNFKTLQLSNMKTHENTHTGSKPNKCPTCCFRCNDPSSLSRHQKEVHGYITKLRSQPALGRSKRRLEKKLSPTAMSSSPGEGSGISRSPIGPPSESYETPLLAPKMLDPHSSSLSPAECCAKDGAKPSSVAFDTLLTTEHYQGNDGQFLPNPEVGSSWLDLPVGAVPSMAPNYFINPLFDQFLAQIDDLEAEVAPMRQHPLDSVSLPPVANNNSYALDNTPAQSYLGHNYALDSSTPYLEPMGVSSHGGYSSGADDASLDPYGYAANEALFDAQFSQGYSFGTPDIDEVYQYPTAGPSSFPTQGSHYH